MDTKKEKSSKRENGQKINRLLDLMAELRGRSGCPWDKKQDLESLRQYVIEEAYEVVEAINRDNMDMLAEELGDLLLQVVFQAQIAREREDFDFSEIVAGLNKKLIRRHPHVFDDEEAYTPDEVEKTWARVKAAENEEGEETEAKTESDSLLEDYSRCRPALRQAREIQDLAARVGFDWNSIDSVLDKVEEEIDELREAVENEEEESRLEEELGDSIFALVNLSRFLSIDPETALLSCLDRFKNRFEYIEKRAEEHRDNIEDISLEQLDAWWEEAKSRKGDS